MPDRLFLSPPHQTGTEPDWLRRALDTNYLAPTGPLLDELEARVREESGLRHALALNSGTAALQLAYHHLRDAHRAKGVAAPPLVIASSLSFIASVAPALHLGFDVWLVDCEEESWTLDPLLLSAALREAAGQGRPVTAVVPTDLYGQACDLDAIAGLCEPAGIPVLVDAAEALGVETDFDHAPWARVVSFNGNKIITASAGGALASNDPALMDHARKLSMQAREPAAHYQHRELGYNLRLSHLLAAVALSQWETLPQRVTRRRAIFDRYRERLDGVPGLSWMPGASWNTCTRWLSVCLLHSETSVCTPEDARRALEAENIEARPVWKPLHQQPALAHLRVFNRGVADRLFHEGLCLPSGSGMTDADVDRVADILRARITG